MDASTARNPRRVIVVSFLGAALACNRFEYVRDVCPPKSSSEPRSAVGWQSVPEGHGSIEVRILDLISEQRLRDASVRIQRDSTAPFIDVPADSDRHRLQGVEPGQYVLEVRRIGYLRARTSVLVHADSGVRALSIMAPDRMVLDGCGYVVVAVKKPWWKLW